MCLSFCEGRIAGEVSNPNTCLCARFWTRRKVLSRRKEAEGKSLLSFRFFVVSATMLGFADIDWGFHGRNHPEDQRQRAEGAGFAGNTASLGFARHPATHGHEIWLR